ncbi:phage tail tape measure protein [Salmonella enterica]|nr:phage tail tape measure protein [Salmonella enterica]
MASKNMNLAVKLQAIDKMSAPLKNVAGASGQVIESLKQTQERLKAIDSQTDQFNAFRQLRQQSKETTQALDQAQQEVTQLALRMKEAQGPTKALKRDLDAAERQVAELAQEMKAAQQPNDLLTYRFKEAQKEANRLGQEFRRTERENKSLSREFDQAKNRVNQLQQAHLQETQKLQEMRQALNRAGVSTKDLAGAQSKAKQEASQLNQEFDRQAKKLERIAEIEARVAKSKERLQKSMQVSANMTVAAFGAQQAGQTIKQALGGPMQVAADFEEQMAGVAAVANATDDQLSTLTATARRLGAETSFSASESAEGMKYLAMAGFKTNQIIASMPGLLDLAKAGATDLGATSDIASDILSGFGMKPEQMSRVSDVLTATFTTANTNLTMLGETMKYVAPVARQAGMSLEETAAMAGLLGNVGIKSSQAGTTLRAMVSRLAAPTGAAAKTLERLGVSTKDASGDMRNMVEIIGDIAEATENMGSAEKLQVLKDVFGEEPAAGMAELLSQEGAGGITKYLEVVNNANGRAAQVANKMGDNAKGKLKELSSAAESLQITLGNALLPVVKDVSTWLTEVTRGVDKWAEAHPGLVRVLTIAGAAVGALAAAGAPLLLAMASINSMMAMTRYGMTAFGAISQLTAVRMGLVTAAQWALNAAILANPITWIIVAVVALIAVLGVLIYKYFEPLKAFLSGFWDGFIQGFAPVIQSCSGLFAALSPIGDALGWVWNGVKAVFDWFGRLFQPVNASAESLQAATSAGTSFGQFVGAALNILLFPVKLVIAGITNLVNLISWAVGVAGAAWEGIKSGAFSLWDALKTVFEWSPIGLMMKGWGVAFNWIKGKLDWLGSAVSKVKSFFGFGGGDEQAKESGPNLEQLAEAEKTRQQAEAVARLEVVKPSVPEPQVEAAKRVSAPKAAAAAGVIAASAAAMPAAAEPVQLSPVYQETVATYQAPAVSVPQSASIPALAASQPVMAGGGTTISIGQLDIHVQGNQGMDTQELAIEVRKQFMQLMHEQQAKHRGDLYDS